MSQGFRLRYDQLRENDPTGSDDGSGPVAADLYPSPGYARNLCLVWPDGRRIFLNYAYLVACEYEPNTEKNLIRLSFSSHQITLKGYRLEPMFLALLDHLPRFIVAIDKRYIIDTDLQPSVVDIIIDQAST